MKRGRSTYDASQQGGFHTYSQQPWGAGSPAAAPPVRARGQPAPPPGYGGMGAGAGYGFAAFQGGLPPPVPPAIAHRGTSAAAAAVGSWAKSEPARQLTTHCRLLFVDVRLALVMASNASLRPVLQGSMVELCATVAKQPVRRDLTVTLKCKDTSCAEEIQVIYWWAADTDPSVLPPLSAGSTYRFIGSICAEDSVPRLHAHRILPADSNDVKFAQAVIEVTRPAVAKTAAASEP